MQITVFGATGRTGIPLVRQALVAGHEVVAFVRSPTKLTVEHDRLTVVEGDAYTGAGVREAIAGTDAVVSVLGQTDSGPDDLLTPGTISSKPCRRKASLGWSRSSAQASARRTTRYR